ncbi:hypothetical protein BRC81_06525 [Halobacteriales archaeon QS_1_68_20]|nr:MAG: hypothetical protein BRC81_06525 [Halobacteriales archaeon QS_1_68_20]
MTSEDAGGPSPTREGMAAGVVTVAFFLVLLVGPWQEFALRRAEGGTFPVDVVSVDGGGGGVYVAAAIAAVVAFVTCVRYRRSVDIPYETYRERLVGSILLSPIVVALLGVIAVVLWSMAQTGHDALGGLVGVYVGSLAWSVLSLFAGLFVGLPAAVGAVLGGKYVDYVD